MSSRVLKRSKRGSKDAAPDSPSAVVAAAFVEVGARRSSMMSMNRCSSAAKASSAASSATVLFRVFGGGGLASWSGCFIIRMTSRASCRLFTGSRYSGGAVVWINLLSRIGRSFPLTIIFCFLTEGPIEAVGVCETADSGVGG